MKRISIQQAQTGEIIAKPVENESGQVLCAEGTPVTEKLLHLLEQWEINVIFIEGEDEDTKSPDELISELNERFARVAHDPFMGQLKDLIKRRIDEGTITR